MKEIKGRVKKMGLFKEADIRVFVLEPGDSFTVDDEPVVDKDEFFSILDKASQPIKKNESDKS